MIEIDAFGLSNLKLSNGYHIYHTLTSHTDGIALSIVTLIYILHSSSQRLPASFGALLKS